MEFQVTTDPLILATYIQNYLLLLFIQCQFLCLNETHIKVVRKKEYLANISE